MHPPPTRVAGWLAARRQPTVITLAGEVAHVLLEPETNGKQFKGEAALRRFFRAFGAAALQDKRFFANVANLTVTLEAFGARERTCLLVPGDWNF